MKLINEGIVFSNDIERILRGKNALDFNYELKGMVIPNLEVFNDIREDFMMETNQIFSNSVTILNEEEMYFGMNEVIKDVLGRIPHYIFG